MPVNAPCLPRPDASQAASASSRMQPDGCCFSLGGFGGDGAEGVVVGGGVGVAKAVFHGDGASVGVVGEGDFFAHGVGGFGGFGRKK